MIAIIDYGLGNLGSMANMLKKVGMKAVVSSDKSVIENAERLILPGVGAFDAGMTNLYEQGLVPLLNELVLDRKILILGVCLGMQLMAKKSDEGEMPGLGWIDAEVVRFRFDNGSKLKIPHMGWNTLEACLPHPLLNGLSDENRFYFVHSFHALCADSRNVLSQTRYGFPFTSAIARDNILGVQFHPEKSHRFGMQLLRNFVGIT